MDSRNKPGQTPATASFEKKMIIRFDNGNIKTSGKGDLKVQNCAYNSWGMESTGISFSADCGSSDHKTSDASPASSSGMNTGSDVPVSDASKNHEGVQMTGTVNGETIHGVLTCTKNDGSIRTYSYTGSKAGKNDLDMENEMGMK
jgi:hypothetical protein